MVDVAITGTGTFLPGRSVGNEELVDAFNKHVDLYNNENAEAIEKGELEAKSYSSAAFIEKASGIKTRNLIDPDGILDPKRMSLDLSEEAYGDDDTPSLQAHMAIEAAKQAIENAGLQPSDIDMVICSAATMQRYFPAMGIEVQKFLGITGSSMDMVMACSSATYGMIQGISSIKAGLAKRVLMVNPEIFSTMVNFTDRDSHFIFGDIASACVIEAVDTAKSDDVWLIKSMRQETKLSGNIFSNFGPISRHNDENANRADMYFVQQGRKVFKELLPMVTDFISAQLDEAGLTPDDLNRMWLHQANINMNMYAVKKLLGREPSELEAPTVLSKYGNIAGAGSLVAFHEFRDDLSVGDKGLICSFGAGYSLGSMVVEKIK